MTLSLYVLRHAKAETAAPGGGADHERSLRPRGRRAARMVGLFLTGLEEAPELVLSSTAARARETAEIAAEEGGWGAPIRLSRAIYEAKPETLLGEIAACADGPRRIVLVGHEPGLSLLIAALVGSEPAFPTAALARIDFELGSWSELRPGSGRLAWLVTPETITASLPRRRMRHRRE
jgi:phosphohistidine phosphatase